MKNLMSTLMLSLFGLISCTEARLNNTLNSRVVQIDTDDRGSQINLSSFTDSIRLIPLQTDSNCYISRITKVVYKDDKLFIHDKKRYSIFVFDMNGNFISKVNSVGRGPGEYMDIEDFWVDDIKKNISIWSHNARSILTYNYEGKYLNRSKMSQTWARERYPLSTGETLGYNFNKEGDGIIKGLFLMNKDGSIQNTIFESNKEAIQHTVTNSIECLGNSKFSIFLRNESSIIDIEGDSILSKTDFVFKNKRDASNIVEGVYDTDDVDFTAYDYKSIKNYYFITWVNNKTMHPLYTVYNRSDNKAFVSKVFMDDYSYLGSQHVNHESNENSIIMKIDASHVVACSKSDKFPKELFPEELNNVGMNDNPIIEIVYL